MNKAIVPAILAIVASATDAHAQRSEIRGWLQERLAAPSRALELTVGSGYTQGLGMLRGSTSLPSVSSAGVALELGAGARINERLSVALVAQYHELIAERGSAMNDSPSLRGVTGGIAGTYHIAPTVRIDPWIEIGTGYRVLWQRRTNVHPASVTHGLSLARARVGVDFRVVHEIALGPVVGADANVFLWQDVIAPRAIDDVRLSAFIFAGVQGRIDVGGTFSSVTALTSEEVERRK